MIADKAVYFNKALIDCMEKLGGLETTKKIIAGEISSGGLCRTLKIEFKTVSLGEMMVECEYDPDLHSNPFGIANGGWHGAMLDNAAGYAGLSTVPPGYSGFTREMTNIRYYKPVISGFFQAKGEVLSQKGNRIECYGEIIDQTGERYADTNLTLSIKPIAELRQKFADMGIDMN